MSKTHRGLRQRLSAKEVPFLVALFLAWAGWAVGHFVDRVVESPTIEYRMDPVAEGGMVMTKVYLTNLSRQAFFDLRFELQGQGIRPCNPPGVRQTPPAWPTSKDPRPGTDGIVFDIQQIHPDWRFSICAITPKDVPPHLYLRETGKDGPGTRQALRLIEHSWETWFVRNELNLVIGLFVIASLLAITWLMFSDRAE